MLSTKRQRLLGSIRDYIQEKGYSPSIREIARSCHINSPSIVQYHLGILERDGYIARDPSVPRSIRLTKPAPVDTGVPRFETAGSNAHVDAKGPRWELQRQNVISAATSLFTKKGYFATSIADIAEAANVNKGAIYYYFRSKSDVLYQITLKTDEVRKAADQIVGRDLPPEKKLEALIASNIRWQMSNFAVDRLARAARQSLPPKPRKTINDKWHEYRAIILTVIEQGIAEGEFRASYPKLAALFVLGFTNSILQWFKPNEELSSEEVAFEAAKFVSQALKDSRVAMTPASSETE